MVAYQSLKTKEKYNPKSGRGCLWEQLQLQFIRGFTKVIVTGAGGLREYSGRKESIELYSLDRMIMLLLNK